MKAFLEWLGTLRDSVLSLPELHLFFAFARNTFLSETNKSDDPAPPTTSASPDTEPISSANPTPNDNNNDNNTKPKASHQLPADPHVFFKLSKQSTPAQVALLSAIAHLCAVACADGAPILRRMLFAPAELANVFLPAFSDDNMQMFIGKEGERVGCVLVLTFFCSRTWWWLV